jgi:hypothetical protein
MIFVVVFSGISGVGFPDFSAIAVWDIKDAGTAGRDNDALGVVRVLSG